MRFQVLGPVSVEGEEGSLALGGPRQRAVLAMLLVHADRVLPADRLIDEVWGDAASEGSRDSLYTYVSNLRKVLGADRLERVGGGYRLRLRPGELDAEAFAEEAEHGRELLASDRVAAVGVLAQALDRWWGDAYQGIDLPSVSAEAVRLEELRFGAVEDRLEALLDHGAHAAVVGELGDLCERYPLRERLWRLRMLALYLNDRQAEALAAYRRVRTLLAEDLGIEPSAELQRLEERILQQDPLLRPVVETPHNLPAPLTSFVGRRLELIEIHELLGDARLVTLIGAAGSGKTRLGLKLAREALDAFPDGVWLVDLAPQRRSDLVPGAVAAVLGVRESPERAITEGLQAHLRRRRVLLVLDNCEHLVEGVARLAHELMESGEGVRILATSREVLGVPGEVVYEVGGLTVPDDDVFDLEAFDAVRLFAERARNALVGFRLTDRNAPLVAQICRRLDGLPLMLELAAAGLRTIGLERLSMNLDDRLRFLTSGPRTVASRQQTPRGAIDLSYDLLTNDEREVFNLLSVFAGSFTLEAAEYVCADDKREPRDVMAIVARLVDKSLLTAVDDASTGFRYRMLEIIRLYGQDRLRETGDVGEAQRRHAGFYRDLLVGAADEIRDGHSRWLDRLEIHHDDLRRALSWADETNEIEIALDLAGALFGFWLMRWHLAEAREWYARLRPLVRSGRSMGRGRVLEGYGAFASEGEESVAAYEQAATVYRNLGDEKSRWRVLQNLGFRLVELGETERAREIFEESVSTMQAVGSMHGCPLQILAQLVYEEGEVDKARQLFEAGAELGLRYSNAPCQSTNLQRMAALERFEGNRARARSLLDQALDLARRLGIPSDEGAVIAEMAMLERDEGNLEAARRLLEQSLAKAHDAGELFDDAESVVWWARRLASLEALDGCAERAVRLYGGVHAHARAGFDSWYDFERYTSQRYLEMCRAALGAEACARAWEEGAVMKVAELRDCMAEPSPLKPGTRRGE